MEKGPGMLKLDSILQSIEESEFHSASDVGADPIRTPRLLSPSSSNGAGAVAAVEDWSHLPTLQVLESTSVCSGTLFKLNASADAAHKWKQRHVVLTQSTLHLFHSNMDPTATPISSLPVTNSQSFVDSEYIMRVHGTGETPDGFVVKRIWTLRAESQLAFAKWTQAIGKNTLRVREPRTVSRSVSERSVSVPRSQYLRINSDQSLPILARQSADNSEREARMRAQHSEYIAAQRETSSVLRRAMEDKEREERENNANPPPVISIPAEPVKDHPLHKVKSTAAINDKTNQMQLLSGMYSLW
ncbi:hypothetical protein HDU81_010000 [Chytriomyces hyalinus]|nr:hypothetical protein HDU81_010000 [Chytriomyces hyalinus]